MSITSIDDRLRQRTTQEICGELVAFLNETEDPEALTATTLATVVRWFVWNDLEDVLKEWVGILHKNAAHSALIAEVIRTVHKAQDASERGALR